MAQHFEDSFPARDEPRRDIQDAGLACFTPKELIYMYINYTYDASGSCCYVKRHFGGENECASSA